MPDLTTTLSDEHPSITVDIIAPDGRVLSVSVGIPNLGPHDEGTSRDDAFVVFLDTDSDQDGEPWEPTPRELRVNVNDGPIWNYPHTHGWTALDDVPGLRPSPSTNADLD